MCISGREPRKLHRAFYMKLIIISLISWLSGIVVYLSLLYLFYEQTISRNDFRAVIVWSFIAAFISYSIIYVPFMLLLHRLLRGCKPVIAFPGVASLLFIIPTMFIFWMSSTSISNFFRDLISPEALLFYSLFIATGVSFGLGFVWCCHQDAKP